MYVYSIKIVLIVCILFERSLLKYLRKKFGQYDSSTGKIK